MIVETRVAFDWLGLGADGGRGHHWRVDLFEVREVEVEVEVEVLEMQEVRDVVN
jgi:hypothetical protein